jgi:WD40 repeat protein
MLLLQGEKHKLERLVFSHDSKTLAVPMYRKGVQVWRAPFDDASGMWIPYQGSSNSTHFVDNDRLLIRAGDCLFQLFNIKHRTGRRIEGSAKTNIVTFDAVSPDGRYFVAMKHGADSFNKWVFCRDLTMPDADLWRERSTQPMFATPLFLRDDRVLTFHISIRKRYCVVRSLATGKTLATHTNLPVKHVSPNVSADGSIWAAITSRSILVYSVDNFAEPLTMIPSAPKTPFTSVAFHPSGRYLLTSSVDQSVKVYDTATWELLRTYDWGQGKLCSVVVSPDGTLVAAGGDKGQIVLWDWE